MREKDKLRHGRHVIFHLNAHLVFVPKYRRKVITKNVFEILEGVFRSVCSDLEAELLEVNFEADHVHLLVEYPPKLALARLVNSLKGVSARRLRAANLAEIRNETQVSLAFQSGLLFRSS